MFEELEGKPDRDIFAFRDSYPMTIRDFENKLGVKVTTHRLVNGTGHALGLYFSSEANRRIYDAMRADPEHPMWGEKTQKFVAAIAKLPQAISVMSIRPRPEEKTEHALR